MQSTNQTTTLNMPVLQAGTSGEAVRFLQQLLICYGYMTSDNFNANFNEVTKSAVKSFQANHGLKADGVVGKMTWRALGDACANRY
ncbi:MAG: peptidoglycan-binding domain-containing protein [Phormidium sp.]